MDESHNDSRDPSLPKNQGETQGEPDNRRDAYQPEAPIRGVGNEFSSSRQTGAEDETTRVRHEISLIRVSPSGEIISSESEIADQRRTDDPNPLPFKIRQAHRATTFSSAERVGRENGLESTAGQSDIENETLKLKDQRRSNRSPDTMTQSLILLATMTVMLLSARFIVPPVVEEIRYAWRRGQLRAEYETADEGLKNVSLDSLATAYQMVSSVAGPSVTHIDVKRSADMKSVVNERDQIWRERGMLSGRNRIRTIPTSDQGSGVVVDDEGYILTNAHVVAGGDQILVTLADGRRREAVLVGTDPMTDLAVLKINAVDLIPATWGDSDDCRVGTPVWAVGSPFGLDQTVTFGILSGKHRMVRAGSQYQDFMQSDVAVNPGNSGGPLVDSSGKLVGINTAIVGDTYQGVSFSIPSNTAQLVFNQLKASGRMQLSWLGVALAEVPDRLLVDENVRIRGAMIEEVVPGQPAQLAGLMPGDIVVDVNGERISGVGHLIRKIGHSSSGSTVDIEVDRDGERLHFRVQLTDRPSA